MIPADEEDPSLDLSDQRPTPGSRSRFPAKTATFSSSTTNEATERTAPEKAAGKKMLVKAERIVTVANNA